jgi:exoribonuclease R
MLAVCLGRFNGYEHFYTNSGKWFSALGIKTLFVLPKFAEPAELEPIIAEIPLDEISPEEVNALKDLDYDPSRMAGAPLLRRMLEFTHMSETIYQDHAAVLDSSSVLIVDPVKTRCLTLHEIADLLLPSKIKKEEKFSPEALYAVHRALLQDEITFRPLQQTGVRKSYLYEISPRSDIRLVQKVEFLVRDYLEKPPSKRHTEKGPLHNFVENARQAIDASRRNRAVSPHAMIGPSSSPTPEAPEWSPTDIEILHFLELWASYRRFPNYSNLQCIGSVILRSLDRYEDMSLDPATGWTFLQEVGWTLPWDIHARYSVRLPDVGLKRTGGFDRHLEEDWAAHLQPDIFRGYRKNWHLAAYAIDGESTMDIDDAVSVERTQSPEKNWIHVHVADPASSIRHDSPIAKFASLVPETVYLQGHFSQMLPDNLGVNKFSLASGRRALTFSALVDNHGKVLTKKITPGILKNVVYMTPQDVNETLGEKLQEPAVTGDELTVGSRGEKKWDTTRKLTRPQDVTPEQKSDLALLLKLAKALQDVRLESGAMPFYQTRPAPSVNFDGVTQTERPSGFITVAGDPSIQVRFGATTGTTIVDSTMKLAGEVAARWCHERNIPIPYRTQPQAVQNLDLIKKFTNDVLAPLVKSGVRPETSHWRHLRVLLGTDQLSTKASPHVVMGVKMYTKVTSPLRRFADLIVHWQIEAALLEEKRRGSSGAGNTDTKHLPFQTAELGRLLAMLEVRERQVKLLSNGTGAEQWVLQALVRAWRFGEATLPATFRFTVDHVKGRRTLLGRLDWLDLSADLRPDAMHGIIRMADVRLNDVFEVKLKDVNVYSGTVLVEALRLVKRGEGPKAKDAAASSSPDAPPVEDAPAQGTTTDAATTV